MTPQGLWTIGFAFLYTVLLVFASRIMTTRSKDGDQNNDKASQFFVGSRKFSALTVAFCITGLFSGSSFIAIMELSYQTGISAIWYGVAETVQILLIALLLIKPLREKLVITVSGLIGDHFGRGARFIAGAITAFTFPMWSVSTAIAFAFALHAFTDFSIYASIIFTALLLLIFLYGGGMKALALTQTLNTFLFAIMALLGVVAFIIKPGVAEFSSFLQSEPLFSSPFSVGATLIIAWFGTFIVNVILAQAVFQMSLSCDSAKEGQKGLYLAAWFGIPLILVGILLGTTAAFIIPNQSLGLLAVPHYISSVLPAPLTGLFFLGIWACALGWAGPCQFSGATSLGRDVGLALRPHATEKDLVLYTRLALILMTTLMVLFAFLRAKDAAWWNVLAWTLRNGTTLAPVLALFFWPLANRKAILIAMLAGFLSGLYWYHAGEWSAKVFYLNLHPVWIGMSINIITLIVVTLLTSPWQIYVKKDHKQRLSLLLAGSTISLLFTLFYWSFLQPYGFGGLTIFINVLLLATLIFLSTQKTVPIHQESRELLTSP